MNPGDATLPQWHASVMHGQIDITELTSLAHRGCIYYLSVTAVSSYTSLPCSANRCNAVHMHMVGHEVQAAKPPEVN